MVCRGKGDAHTGMKEAPVGFFDSGVGGISVLKKALEIMPGENYIYYGDNANAPYGSKTNEEIFHLGDGWRSVSGQAGRQSICGRLQYCDECSDQ